MNITTWTNNINSLNISQSIKETIITFFINFKSHNSLNFIKVDNDTVNNALNNINNYKTILLCMDAEFQATITNIKYIKELGMLLFIRDKYGDYYYVGFIFINFMSVVEYNVNINDLRPIYTTYSTVTSSTLKKMEDNEKVFLLDQIINKLENANLFKIHDQYLQEIDNIMIQLNNNHIYKNIINESTKKSILNNFDYLKKAETYDDALKEINYMKRKLMKTKFDIYGKKLQKTDLYINFLKSHELYWNDNYVKERLRLITNKEITFFDLFSQLSHNSLFVVKGAQDFIAFNNMVKLLKIKVPSNFENYYDIETFNGLSNHLYSSSQLENTYNNIIKTKIFRQFAKPIFDVISNDIGGKAHNPVVDSLFTIIVAVTINIGLIQYFQEK